MIELGNTLRTAREAKGLTLSQLAEQTRLSPATVEDLEHENFEHIAAPIYGRGFIKLYCEAVGIDPKPLIAEFMAIYNGEHVAAIREREVVSPTVEDAVPPVSEPIMSPAEKPAEHTIESSLPFDEPPADPPLCQPLAEEPAPKDPIRIFKRPIQQPTRRLPGGRPAALPSGAISFAGIGRKFGSSMSAIPWRLCLLGLLAILLFAAILMGIRTLYRTTAATQIPPIAPAEEKPAPSAVTPKPSTPRQPSGKVSAAKDQKPAAKRKPMTVRPLYMD